MLRTHKQTKKQTDKQTDLNVLPTPTDRVSVHNYSKGNLGRTVCELCIIKVAKLS